MDASEQRTRERLCPAAPAAAPQGTEERRRDCALVRRLAVGILQQESDAECAPLRWGKLGERLLANAGQ